MKLKIDTSGKTIQVEEKVNLNELYGFLKKIFPNNEWKEFSIEAVPAIINWYNPIHIPFTYTIPCGSPTVTEPWIVCGTTTDLCITTN